MHDLLLIALIVFCIAVGAGFAMAGMRGFEAWLTFRRVRRAVFGRLDELNAELAKVERRTAKAAENAEGLNAARVRLQRTLAVAAVISGAGGDVISLVRLVRGVVPRK